MERRSRVHVFNARMLSGKSLPALPPRLAGRGWPQAGRGGSLQNPFCNSTTWRAGRCINLMFRHRLRARFESPQIFKEHQLFRLLAKTIPLVSCCVNFFCCIAAGMC
jgi:hypothetical protein